MKKVLTTSLVLGCMMAASAVFATAPITVINNTNDQIDFGFSHCNDQSLCTFVKGQKLGGKNLSANSVTIMAPVGMENLSINTAKLVDQAQNTIATLNGACNAPSAANVIILDNYGSNKLVCTYGYTS